MQIRTAVLLVILTFLFIPNFVLANSGDFSGGVAIGTGYAGINAAPTNGLIVQGGVGIGTTLPTTLLDVAGVAQTNQLVINETGNTYNGSIEITYNDLTNYGIFFQDTNTGTTNAAAILFARNAATVGYIFVTPTGTSYNTASDSRLKQNITDTVLGLKQALKIPVHDFEFISDPNKTREQGLIAQELYTIYPEAVSPGGKDPKKKPWTIDYGRMTPLLLKAIQDQQEEIDSLKQELKTLKTQLTATPKGR